MTLEMGGWAYKIPYGSQLVHEPMGFVLFADTIASLDAPLVE